MTPALVLFFGIPPLTAVSSDLVASAVMKPVGSAVHLRRGTVNLSLVKWLCVGSVPAAFSGVLVLRALGDGVEVQQGIQTALGIALLVSAAGLTVRAYLRLVERARRRDGRAPRLPQDRPEVSVRILPTVVVGVVGGFVVGMTSVGSGSLIIIALMALYPALKASQLVGTDLAQAVPLIIAAAIGHILFGDFHIDLTLSLLLGCVPGAWIGARISSRATGGFVRRVLALVLLASSLKLLGLSNATTGIILSVALLLGPVAWFAIRRHHGFPALVYGERRMARDRTPTPKRRDRLGLRRGLTAAGAADPTAGAPRRSGSISDAAYARSGSSPSGAGQST